MSEHSIIEHRAKYHYAKVEEDYIAICSHGECSPHCKALILSILEGWLNKKFADGEKNLYTYMTIPQWIDHTYRLYERNILIDCLAELVKENLIKRNQITRYNQSTYEYILNTEVVQVLIRALPEKESVYPRLDAYLAFREKGNEKRRERKKAKEEQLKNQLPPIAVEKSTTPPLINNLPPLINQLNVSSYVSSPNVTSSVCNSNQPLEQPEITPTLPDDVAPDYENGQPSMQLSTANKQNVDKSASSDNHSQQSYSHRQDTSPATHVGVMPVLSVPMPPGVSAVQGKPQTPATPPSETLDEKKRLGLIAESIREKAPDIKGVTIAVLKFIDAWDQGKYGPCSLSRWEISNAKDIVLRMKGTIEDALLIADELKRQNKTVKIETVCNCWYLLETLKKPLSVSSHPNLYNEDNFAKDVWA